MTAIKTYSKDPNLHPAAQELLDDAHVLGWSIHQHTAGRRAHTYRIVSPINSSITIEIPPVKQWNEGKLRGIQEKLLRYSDPDKVEALQARKERLAGEHAARLREVREQEAASLAAAQERADGSKEKTPKPTPPAGRPSLQYSKDPQEPHVVDTKPWLVRHGIRDGLVRVYPSHAVVQRAWSDGRPDDFVCVRGDYDNSNPWSVSSHYARSSEDTHPSRDGVPDFRFVSPEEYTAYTPVLTKAPFTRRPVSPEAEEEIVEILALDPAEVLAKIIALVAPDTADVERLRTEVAELTELLTTAELERDQATKRAEEAQALIEAAEAKADRAATALRNFKAALAALDE